MAHICATCRMPVRPVNECICPDDEDGPDDGQAADDTGTAA